MTTPVTRTFPLSGPINLSVRIGHGSLTVTTADDLAEAAVTLTPRSKDADALEHLTVAMRGHTLDVQAPREDRLMDLVGGWKRGRDSVDVAVTVPTGTAVRLMTFTAAITVVGRIGGADISTGTGTITVGEVDGDLRLRFGSAQSRVERVCGSAVVRSGSGDAVFGEVTGDLQAGCGSGDIEVGVIRGTSRLRAGSGNLHLGAAHGDVDFTCGSGQMSIGLPAGVSARLDVRTGSGQVRSDLPIEDDRSGAGPTITVRARAGSGDVRLFRAA